MSTIVRLCLLALVSVQLVAAEADEIRCVFDGEQDIRYEQIDHNDQGVSIEFLFPRSKSGRLHRIDLHYGKQMELFTQIHFEEEDRGYRASLSLERTHQPVELLAIYHHGGCFSSAKATIVDTKVTLSRDGA